MAAGTAIVIGASSGIGREVSRLLIAQGWRVGVAARREPLLEELRRICPERVKKAVIDVLSDDAPGRMISLAEELGGFDLLVYASGVGRKNMLLEPEPEAVTVATNAMGFTSMIGAAYRYMADNGGGHIAVISSIAGTKGMGAAPAYSATKAFQTTYIQALEQQACMRRLPIRFTDIRPGFVATPLLGGGEGYPMLMSVESVAADIVKSINKRRHMRVIDRRYRLLTAAWRIIPGWLWRRMTWIK